MEAILSALPQLVDIIEKGGVPGVLMIVIGVLVYEIRRSRRIIHDKQDELHAVYSQRDVALLAVVKCKTLLEAKDIDVDLSDVQAMIPAVTPRLPK
jgi:hypothetical protein